MNKLGERIKEVRQLRDLSQYELDRLACLPRTTIAHFESSNRNPTIKNLIKVADALNISIDYLVGRTNYQTASSPTTTKLFVSLTKLTHNNFKIVTALIDVLVKKGI